MKDKTNRCPGCSRHCPLNAPRCKYGCRYVSKLKNQTQEAETPLRKWERDVQRGGLLWRLLYVSRWMKKALRKGCISEKELLSLLDESHQQELAVALAALEACLTPCEKCKK